jgi:ankyrin repeat protein
MARKKPHKGKKKKQEECEPDLPLDHLAMLAQQALPDYVESFLQAGGQPGAPVTVHRFEQYARSGKQVPTLLQAPLLHGITLNTHDQVSCCIRMLVRAGAAVDALCPDEEGKMCTALMWVSSTQYGAPAVRTLLKEGAQPGVQSSSGQTALHMAATLGFLDICELLVEADESMVDLACKEGGVTAATSAAANGHVAVLELLHQHGANLMHRTEDGFTPLHYAAIQEDNMPVLKYLLDTGEVDINAVSTIEATSPLIMAANAGELEAVKYLLARGADCGICNARRALHGAVDGGFVEVAAALLQAGADPAAEDETGVNCFHRAADIADRKGPAMLQLLLEHSSSSSSSSSSSNKGSSSSSSSSSSSGSSMRCSSSSSRRSRSVAAALNKLCTACECCGSFTALMACSEPAAVKLLLAAGSDVTAASSNGSTCLHIAAVHAYPMAVVCLLIDAGADLGALNNSMQTPAEVARAHSHDAIAALLDRAARG